MTSITKTEVKDGNNQTVYTTYALPDIASYTKWIGQGKILLEDIEKEIPSINAQTKALFDKQIEIATHYQTKLEQADLKVSQIEAKLDKSDSELISARNDLIQKQSELDQKQKDLETSQQQLKEKEIECVRLLSQFNYNDQENILAETTTKYEEKLKESSNEI